MSDYLAGQLYNAIRDDNEAREMKMWHSSSLAECPRAQYFKRLGIKPIAEVGAGKMLRWKAGHIIEEVIRPYILKAFPDAISNVRLEDKDLDLTGEYDNYSEKEKTIFEIKSVHTNAFAYRKVGADRYDLRDSKPYLNHELQNHCYVKLLRNLGKPVEFITYVYITLDGRIATYKTSVNDNILAEVDKRLNILNTAWKTKTPPECLCYEEHPLWKCQSQYCDFRDGNECCSLNLIKEK